MVAVSTTAAVRTMPIGSITTRTTSLTATTTATMTRIAVIQRMVDAAEAVCTTATIVTTMTAITMHTMKAVEVEAEAEGEAQWVIMAVTSTRVTLHRLIPLTVRIEAEGVIVRYEEAVLDLRFPIMVEEEEEEECPVIGRVRIAIIPTSHRVVGAESVIIPDQKATRIRMARTAATADIKTKTATVIAIETNGAPTAIATTTACTTITVMAMFRTDQTTIPEPERLLHIRHRRRFSRATTTTTATHSTHNAAVHRRRIRTLRRKDGVDIRSLAMM